MKAHFNEQVHGLGIHPTIYNIANHKRHFLHSEALLVVYLVYRYITCVRRKCYITILQYHISYHASVRHGDRT